MSSAIVEKSWDALLRSGSRRPLRRAVRPMLLPFGRGIRRTVCLPGPAVQSVFPLRAGRRRPPRSRRSRPARFPGRRRVLIDGLIRVRTVRGGGCRGPCYGCSGHTCPTRSRRCGHAGSAGPSRSAISPNRSTAGSPRSRAIRNGSGAPPISSTPIACGPCRTAWSSGLGPCSGTGRGSRSGMSRQTAGPDRPGVFVRGARRLDGGRGRRRLSCGR